MISVVVTTARLGGLDVLFHSARGQEFKDFEIILVDDYFDLRRGLVGEKAAEFGLNVLHVKGPESEIYNNSSGWNAGLRRCSGGRVCFVIDFQWLPPNYLKDHWQFHEKFGDNYTMTGYLDRYPLPPIKNTNVSPHGLAWSVFEKEFDNEFATAYFTTEDYEYRERKGGIVGPVMEGTDMNEMPGEFIYAINEAFPMALIKQLNGWDERFNGMYGSNDINLGSRANLLGHKFLLNAGSITQKLGTPATSGQLPGIKRPKTGTDAEAFILHKEILARIGRGEETAAVPEGHGAFR